MSVRILIADDHPVFRHGLRALLQAEPGMEVVGEAIDGAEAVRIGPRAQSRDVLTLSTSPRKKFPGSESSGSRSQTSARRCGRYC